MFLSFLMAATQIKALQSNRIAVICVCASIILKYRFKYLNLQLFPQYYILATVLKRYNIMIALIKSLNSILFQVFSRLCSLGLSVSHSIVTELIKELGKDHDLLVKNWRDDIAATLIPENVSSVVVYQALYIYLFCIILLGKYHVIGVIYMMRIYHLYINPLLVVHHLILIPCSDTIFSEDDFQPTLPYSPVDSDSASTSDACYL